jgi:phytoene desaturase
VAYTPDMTQFDTTRPSAHDVIVLGSGVGGLVAAANLAILGRKPLLLELGDRLGGRFSTFEIDGFKVPTGAVAIETSGPFFECFGELGIDPGLRIPSPPVRIRIRGHEMNAGAPAWEHLIKRVTKKAGRALDGIRRGGEGAERITLDAWARRYTRSKTVESMFQTLAATLFTVNADELPAELFFRNLRETGGYKTFGFAPHGNVEIANAIAKRVIELGGEVRTQWTATAVDVEDNRAVAVRASGPDGVEHILTTNAVVSGIGPRNTARLFIGTTAEPSFADRVRNTQPTAMMALAFSTSEDLLPSSPGFLTFTDTRRLCSVANLSATCPDLAPSGRTLVEAYSVPRPGVGESYDVDEERRLLEEDLRDQVEGFDTAQIVHFKAMSGEHHPAHQCAPGQDPPVTTSLLNVVEVGDGVKPPGWIGTTACALTARLAIDALFENGA